jgi:hypothetical protein
MPRVPSHQSSLLMGKLRGYFSITKFVWGPLIGLGVYLGYWNSSGNIFAVKTPSILIGLAS